MTRTNTTHTMRTIINSVASISIGTLITVGGCSKSPETKATNSPQAAPSAAPANSSSANSLPKVDTSSPQAMASSLGLDLPDMKLPTQDELDAVAGGKINASNADTEFAELLKDIDGDGG